MKKLISLLALLISFSISAQQPLIKPKQIEGSTAGSILTTTGTGIPTWTTNIPASTTKAWRTDGNAVASNTAFIGTTDNRSFTIKSYTNSLAKLDSAGQGFTVRSFTAGNMPINISAKVGSFPVLSFQEDLSQNWAIYNNTAIADKPLVWYDAASASNVMVLTKGNLSVINNTNTAVFSGTNLGTAAANFPALTLRGVTYSTSISLPNLNHATLPNTSAWYTNALNGFCLTDGTNKLLSIPSTSASGTGFILRPITIGSTVAPTATLDVKGDLLIGTGSANTTTYGIARISQRSTTVDIGEANSRATIWLGQNVPTPTNYALSGNNGANTFINGPTDIYFKIADATLSNMNSSSNYFSLKTRIGSATTPTATLDVTGTASISGTSTISSITFSTNSINFNQSNATLSNSGNLRLASGSSAGIVFDASLGSANASIFGGSLNIGAGSYTTTPPANLNVLGTMSVSGTTTLSNLGSSKIGTVQIAGVLTSTATLDFPSTAAGTVSDLTLTVTGAVDGDAISLGTGKNAISPAGSFFAWISGNDVATVRFVNNALVTAYDPASATFKVTVIKN